MLYFLCYLFTKVKWAWKHYWIENGLGSEILKLSKFWLFHFHVRNLSQFLLLLVGAPTSICHFFRPSVRPSVQLSVQTISQEPYITWSLFLVHMCQMMISHGGFFHIFKNFWFFGSLAGAGSRKGVWGCKRAKNSPNWKKKHPIYIISQKECSIWSWFLIHLCKMMISPGVFSIFKILIFQVARRGGGG